MATKKAAKPKDETTLKLRPMKVGSIEFTVIGTAPLIVHAWSNKSLEMIRERSSGRKTKNRDARDPEGEAKDATYFTTEGKDGIPGLGFKHAIVSAAHKDIGIEKTLVRKALRLIISDPGGVIPIEFERKEVREDPVRVGQGSADLRYRPCYYGWRLCVKFRVDWDLLRPDDIINLVNRAGFGVGLCEWRPERNGEHGTFEVDQDALVDVIGL